jgi:hypothetical protein
VTGWIAQVWSRWHCTSVLGALFLFVGAGSWLHSRLPSGEPYQHAVWCSPDLTFPPLDAKRTGPRIRLEPSLLGFHIPEQWAERPDSDDSLFLTRSALEAVGLARRAELRPFASLANAALPFDRCVLQVGSGGWTLGRAAAHGELWVRLYDLPQQQSLRESFCEVRARIEKDLRAAPRGVAILETGDVGSWRRISVRLHPDDPACREATASGWLQVDFYLTAVRGHTFVFAFTYFGDAQANHQNAVEAMLASFR